MNTRADVCSTIVFLTVIFSYLPLPSLSAASAQDYAFRIPQEETCFSLEIKQKSDQSDEYLNTFSVLGVIYDHLEGRTVTLGSLPFAQLRKRSQEGKNIFYADMAPDAAEFQLYVFKKDPVTKKITQHKADQFLDIVFIPVQTGWAESSYEPFRFTHAETVRAQKIWAIKESPLRKQIKKYWNKLSTPQKNILKGTLIVATVALLAIGGVTLKNYIQKDRAWQLKCAKKRTDEETKNKIISGMNVAENLLTLEAFITAEDVINYQSAANPSLVVKAIKKRYLDKEIETASNQIIIAEKDLQEIKKKKKDEETLLLNQQSAALLKAENALNKTKEGIPFLPEQDLAAAQVTYYVARRAFLALEKTMLSEKELSVQEYENKKNNFTEEIKKLDNTINTIIKEHQITLPKSVYSEMEAPVVEYFSPDGQRTCNVNLIESNDRSLKNWRSRKSELEEELKHL